jgi:hypothetical protein
MNGDIHKFSLITENRTQDFHDACNRIIDQYQKEGLYVEVQYSTFFDDRASRVNYSAMILGRLKN